MSLKSNPLIDLISLSPDAQSNLFEVSYTCGVPLENEPAVIEFLVAEGVLQSSKISEGISAYTYGNSQLGASELRLRLNSFKVPDLIRPSTNLPYQNLNVNIQGTVPTLQKSLSLNFRESSDLGVYEFFRYRIGRLFDAKGNINSSVGNENLDTLIVKAQKIPQNRAAGSNYYEDVYAWKFNYLIPKSLKISEFNRDNSSIMTTTVDFDYFDYDDGKINSNNTITPIIKTGVMSQQTQATAAAAPGLIIYRGE